MNSGRLLLALVVSVTAASYGRAESAPVAIVSALQGHVSIAANGKTSDAELYEIIYDGNQVIVAADAGIALMFLKDNHLERVKGQRTIAAGHDGFQSTDGVQVTRLSADQQKLLAVAAKDLPSINVSGLSITRGPPEDKFPPAVSPVIGTKIVDQPLFTWPASPGAEAYELELRQQNHAGIIWKKSVALAPTEAAPLKYTGAPLLDRDYSWELHAKLADKSDMKLFANWPLTFTLAVNREAKKIAGLVEFARSSNDPAFLSIAAQELFELQCKQEALDVFRRLTKLVPDTPYYWVQVHKLCVAAGLVDEAKQASQHALHLGVKLEDEAEDTTSEPKKP